MNKLHFCELEGIPALKCRRCEEIKLLEEYDKDSRIINGYRGVCKKCNLEKHRKNTRQLIYGVDNDQYQTMYNEQEGNCNICNEHLEILEIDHCHSTGRIRSLLCGKCNKGLGLFRDNKDLLIKAAMYIGKFERRNNANNE